MRGKQATRAMGGDDDDLAAAAAAAAKARGGSPHGDLPGGANGGFWLAAVQASATGPPHGLHPLETGMHMELPTAETGFINSQPSMAEFMTALPHMPGEIPGSMSPTSGGYGMVDSLPGQQGQAGVNVPEYPWMKEKKTSRKSNQQGKLE